MNIRSLAERGERVPTTRRHGFSWWRYRNEAMESTTWVLTRWDANGQRYSVRIDVPDVVFRDAAVRGDKLVAWGLCRAKKNLAEVIRREGKPPIAPFSCENGG